MAVGGTLELVGLFFGSSTLGPVGSIVAGIGMEIGMPGPEYSFAKFAHEVFKQSSRYGVPVTKQSQGLAKG
jgi:hypothetical protein